MSLSGDRPRAHSAAYGMSFELSEDILIKKTTRSGRGRRPLGSRFDGWSHQITKKTFPGGKFFNAISLKLACRKEVGPKSKRGTARLMEEICLQELPPPPPRAFLGFHFNKVAVWERFQPLELLTPSTSASFFFRLNVHTNSVPQDRRSTKRSALR